MRIVPVLGALSFIAASGCASWFLKGAEMAEQPPASPLATYQIGACTMSTGEVIAGANATYYVANEGGLVLYEMEGGSGARITNHWTEPDGEHFFVWVARSHGWQFVFPYDPARPAVRLIYPAGTYSGVEQAGTMRPVGTPQAQCPLTLVSGTPPSGPAPVAAPSGPPPTAGGEVPVTTTTTSGGDAGYPATPQTAPAPATGGYSGAATTTTPATTAPATTGTTPATTQCAPGRVVGPSTAGRCCWPDQAWNDTYGRCAGPPRCPAGLIAEGDNCVSAR
jgi:hypothetical protein